MARNPMERSAAWTVLLEQGFFAGLAHNADLELTTKFLEAFHASDSTDMWEFAKTWQHEHSYRIVLAIPRMFAGALLGYSDYRQCTGPPLPDDLQMRRVGSGHCGVSCRRNAGPDDRGNASANRGCRIALHDSMSATNRRPEHYFHLKPGSPTIFSGTGRPARSPRKQAGFGRDGPTRNG
jgi:hypothetical protein